MSRFVVIALAALFPVCAGAQIHSAPDFLFRMAHREASKASCILVETDGNFHLEENHHNSTRVFQGTLSADHLAALNALLAGAGFQQLLPEAVSSSLLPTGFEETLISVPRDGRWMSLRFVSGLSRDRNQSLLNQFFKWENSAAKSSRKKLQEESGRNNCLPPGRVELQTRPQP